MEGHISPANFEFSACHKWLGTSVYKTVWIYHKIILISYNSPFSIFDILLLLDNIHREALPTCELCELQFISVS